jgi:parallel beta-helix repeat protein
MKNLLLFFCLFLCIDSFGKNIYVSPSGNDNNNGSVTSPYYSLNRAWQAVVPGDTVYMRGGTYAYTSQIQCYLVGKSGTASNPICIYVYPGEHPVITKGPGYQNNNIHWRGGVFFSGNYTKWKGIEFMGFVHGSDPVSPFIWRGLYIENANFNVFENLVSHDNEYGFNLQDNSKGNLFLNCDAYNNWDVGAGGGNADGFGWGYITVNDPANPNVARGCRSWWNGDDGFDGWHGDTPGGIVVLDSCWSWFNGYYKGTFNHAGNGEGFKMGGGAGGSPGTMMRIYKNCISFHNDNKGFEQNNLNGNGTFYNCIAVGNNNHGFNINNNNSAHVIRNCVSLNNNGTQFFLNTETSQSNNSSSDGSGGSTNNASAADFIDFDISTTHGHLQLSSTRKPDGSLPNITFLHLAEGSDLIDAGVNVGIAYSGNAPDRGAFEFGVGTPPPPQNIPPTATVGSDITITLPTNSIQLIGSGTDPDGTVVGYLWNKISGGAGSIVSPNNATTAVEGLVQGTYEFKLTVTDNQGATGSAIQKVIVNGSAPPPTTGTPLNINDVSPDQGFAYYLRQDFGTPGDDPSNPNQSKLRLFENGVELLPAHTPHADVRNIGSGRFSHWSNGTFAALWFSTSDNTNPKTNGRVYTYTLGESLPNMPPVANAGPDITLTLPDNTVTLVGTGFDSDGTIVGYEWKSQSGSIIGTSASVTLAFNLPGQYLYILTVTDNGGMSASDSVVVTVNPTPPPPGSVNVLSCEVVNTGTNKWVVRTSLDCIERVGLSIEVYDQGDNLLTTKKVYTAAGLSAVNTATVRKLPKKVVIYLTGHQFDYDKNF